MLQSLLIMKQTQQLYGEDNSVIIKLNSMWLKACGLYS